MSLVIRGAGVGDADGEGEGVCAGVGLGVCPTDESGNVDAAKPATPIAGSVLTNVRRSYPLFELSSFGLRWPIRLCFI